MAKRKNGFDITALEKYAERLEAAGGTAAVKRAVEGGMKSTKQQTNARVTSAMSAGNLPAGGKYSTGETMAHLNKEMAVNWEGNMARLKLGFNLDGGGLVSIFLMYGTPHHAPAAGLREALKEDPRKISRKEMAKACKKILERLGG
jgi:hypothetical protein